MNAEKPDWWRANEEDRAALDLPDYEPPRFADDVYVHDVVPDLELRFDCEIRLLGRNVDYLDDWDVRIDGVDRFTIGRKRDDRGNTRYMLTADEFERRVVDEMQS